MTDREALVERMTEAFVQTLLPGDELAVQRRIANLTYKRAMSNALAVIEAEPSQSVSEAREAVVQSVLRRKHERQRGAGKGVAGMSPVPRR